MSAKRAYVDINRGTADTQDDPKHRSSYSPATLASTLTLCDAASRGRLGVVRLRVREGGPLKLATALRAAIRHKHLAVVQYLVQEGGADPNHDTTEDDSPLNVAALAGALDIVQWLVQERGVDPNRVVCGETPLCTAVERGHRHIAEWLVREGGADPNYPAGDGFSPLCLAALGQGGIHLDSVRWLVREAGADLNRNSSETNVQIPLSCAVQGGDLDVVRWLLREGADANHANDDGCTALHVAAKDGEVLIIEELVARGCLVHRRSNEGKTALHLALSNKQYRAVTTLVIYGGSGDFTMDFTTPSTLNHVQRDIQAAVQRGLSLRPRIAELRARGRTALSTAMPNSFPDSLQDLILGFSEGSVWDTVHALEDLDLEELDRELA